MNRRRVPDVLFFVALLSLSIAIRLTLLSFESVDYLKFLEPWYDFIVANGVLGSLKHEFSNYAPAYLHLLGLSTLLPFEKIVSVKLISISFDFVLAAFAYAIVRARRGILLAWGAFFTILFAPTVVINSALWGQSDAIFASSVLLCIYFLIKDRGHLALIAFGAALAFKLQAIFFLPALVMLWLKGRIRLRSFLFVPAVMFATFVPSLIAGRPLTELLRIYLQQSGYYDILVLNAPTIYQWLPTEHFGPYWVTGVILTAAVMLALSFVVYKSRNEVDPDFIIKLSLLSVLIVPYLLPKMHDRYFYLADVISILYGFYNPKRFYVPILIVMCSFFSYLPFLSGNVVFDFSLLAVVIGVVIVIVLLDTDLDVDWGAR